MRYAFGILLGCVMAAGAWAEISPAAPDLLVKSTTDEVLSIIKQDKDIKQDRQRLLDLIQVKVLPHFNFTRMTQRALGKNWRSASDDQKKVLTREFTDLLVRTYSSALEVYQDQSVDVKPLRAQAADTDVTVKTVVSQTGGQPPVAIDYSMEKDPDGWKVYDVVVEGVSLVTSYRSSFADEVQRSGIDGLIKALQEKNRSLQSARSASKDRK